ncbi:MAG: DNA repair protein RecN [Deltaproteobacteria bacterium]|nr:DNA repair protein RecN [Candidatus Anaeroferrophillacea bacterium]
MLESLEISNFRLIERLQLTFEPGLTAITGETGAGKSIILSALALALGEKPASGDFLDPERPITITARFTPPLPPRIPALLNEQAFPPDDDGLICRRVVTLKNDRFNSRAFVNDQPATARTLAALGRELVDIASQHEQQDLLKPELHLDLMDHFGGLREPRRDYAGAWKSWVQAAQKLDEFDRAAAAGEQEMDFIRHQWQELDAAGLETGEEDELLAAQQRYQQREQLLQLAVQAEALLYSEEASIIDGCYRVQALLDDLGRRDSGFRIPEPGLPPVIDSLQDMREVLTGYRDAIDIDPQTAEDNNRRLMVIDRLKRKHGISFAGLLERREELAARLAARENHDTRRAELKSALDQAAADLAGHAATLSQVRRETASRLEREVAVHLGDLRLSHARFAVRLDADRHGPRGADRVQFLLSTNPGEDPAPLDGIISGGELSRFLLAFKTAVASRYGVPTLIFDEVDTGIGGAVADAVGRKLAAIAAGHQVIAITHLPQVAAWGDHHQTVAKNVDGEQAIISVLALADTADRVDELARMGGPGEIGISTRAHARELLDAAARRRTVDRMAAGR